jgi:hypothetical protein
MKAPYLSASYPPYMKINQIGFWSEIKLGEIAIVEGRK